MAENETRVRTELCNNLLLGALSSQSEDIPLVSLSEKLYISES